MRADQPEPDDPDAQGGGTLRPDSADRAGRAGQAGSQTEAATDPEQLHPMETGPERDPQRGSAAPVSRAEQLTAHIKYRETVEVTLQAAADRATWNEALPGLRASWEEHKKRYPEQTQAAPRTETDGTWACGEHRRLDPEQNTEASKAHADLADEAGQHILPALRRIEAADPERRLAGLDHMVKGEDRLKEKLADAWHGRPGLSTRQVLGMIPDAVRFTFTYSSERYAEGVLADVGRLKAEGYELIKLKNLWHADQYRGINSQWFRSETGTRIEMQFHTTESLEAKELTHEAYERIRAITALPADEQNLEEEHKLENFQRRVNVLVSTPPGTDRIRDFPEKNNG